MNRQQLFFYKYYQILFHWFFIQKFNLLMTLFHWFFIQKFNLLLVILPHIRKSLYTKNVPSLWYWKGFFNATPTHHFFYSLARISFTKLFNVSRYVIFNVTAYWHFIRLRRRWTKKCRFFYICEVACKIFVQSFTISALKPSES